MSCGQLATYANRDCPDEVRSTIATLYPQISDGNVVLFLGAGASSNVWNARELAARLYAQLGFNEKLPEGFGLSEVADFYEARNKRKEMDAVLVPPLTRDTYPSEYLHVTRFQWKAIYTTNYDLFLENAYRAAKALRLTEY